MSQKIISQLEGVSGLRLECPGCDESFSVKKAKLFGMFDSYPPAAREILHRRMVAATDLKAALKERKKRLSAQKQAKPSQITVTSEATNFGQISEHIIPAFHLFPYRQSECRPLFKPVDYIVFRGLAKNGRVHALTFVDVKTGGARLSPKQRQIRDLISDGKLRHKVIGQ